MRGLLDAQTRLFTKNIVHRKRYYDKLSALLETKQTIIIQGQRRVGKSSLVLGYCQYHDIGFDQIFFFNKELDEHNMIRSFHELSILFDEYVAIYGEPQYIFVDEVQDIDGRERFIRAKHTQGTYHIIVSGSNAHLLSTDLTTYLSGRYMSLHVFPLDYPEYLLFTGQHHSATQFADYIRRGGLPDVHTMQTDDQKQSYLSSMLDTIILKDIVSRFSIKDSGFLRKILHYLADTIGSPQSLRNIKNASTHYGRDIASLTTLSSYLSYLQIPYLLYATPRFDIHGKKMLEHNEKYYFNDIGIRNALRVHMTIDIGKILENIVYLHLRKLGYTVYVGTMRDKEIDFLAQKGNTLTYIQVAYLITDETTHQREFGNLLAIKDAYPKIVVSADPLAHGNHLGIQWLSINDFLHHFT